MHYNSFLKVVNSPSFLDIVLNTNNNWKCVNKKKMNTPITGMRLSTDLRNYVEYVSNEKGITLSEYIRMLIEVDKNNNMIKNNK